MKISKARLVEIIKEEIENLEEMYVSPRDRKSIETGFRRERPTGSREGYVEPFGGPVADAAKARRDAEVASDEQINKIKKDIFARIMKWANDNVATERDARRMDQEASKEDFARVMDWANKEGVATEEDIKKQIEQNLDQRLKYYTPKRDHGQLKKQISSINSDDFIDKVVLKAFNAKLKEIQDFRKEYDKRRLKDLGPQEGEE